MGWDYAALSEMAKAYGGPEKLVETLIQYGKSIGHKEMLPVVGAAMGIGALGSFAIQKGVEYFKSAKLISLVEVKNSKEELIHGIENYDLTHGSKNEAQVIT